ncbi:MAG: DNA mismatch repair protein MutS [Roseivirga sp.]|nr:DNA mismatch repair protein MutS [Roseivirga sp.]
MFKAASKKRDEILTKQPKLKQEHFGFKSISQYWYLYVADRTALPVSDQTYTDLDMDEVFMFADRTVSKPGQQYLYSSIRSIPETTAGKEGQEKLIQQFADDKSLKAECILALAELNKPEAHYLTSLFCKDYIKKPKWFWVVPLLALLSCLTLIFGILVPKFWFLPFLILAINFAIHYWNKQNLYEYGVSIPELLKLLKVAKRLRDLTKKRNPELDIAIKKLDSLSKSLFIFSLEKGLQSDMGQIAEFFIELIRAYFLIEPILLFRSLKKLEEQKEHIHQLFQFVGKTDTAISILSLRSEAETSCQPEIINQKSISAKAVYHPLLVNPVPNSLKVDNKSVLLTGSNMSGKTTFIRTIGINAILGQTLNTCFADNFSMPLLHVHSAIRISDDLMNDKSYFFEEVLTIKEMVETGNSSVNNLFLLDELFKGTNTLERIAAGKAILSHLNTSGNLVFIATHDLELADYLEDEYDLYHFSETVEDQKINFDYLLKPGNLVNTNALKILALNDFPEGILNEANKLAEQMKRK